MTFSAESLCTHVDLICHEIGPRLASSIGERAAAHYVESRLYEWGLVSERQTFQSIDRFSKRLAPQFALSATTLGAGVLSRGFMRWIAGAVGLACVWHTLRLLKGQPALWEEPFADAPSQNVIACLPASGETRQRVVLVAHLDTNFARISYHPGLLNFLPLLLGGASLATLGGALLTILANDKEWSKSVRVALAGYLMAATLMTASDEFALPVVGANDNASGVAVLLGLAQQLKRTPLQQTEVWLVFSGAAESGMTGIDSFLRQHAPDLHEATFVVIDAVGAGELCWVTDHSLSAGVHYQPHPEAVKWAECAAQKRPELGVMGRSMLTLDEIAVLKRFDLKGVSLMGYDRLSGHVPNKNQGSDVMAHVEGEKLVKAAEFVWTMLGEIDA